MINNQKKRTLILLSAVIFLLVSMPLGLYIAKSIQIRKAINYLTARGVQIEGWDSKHICTISMSNISISAEDCEMLELLAPDVCIFASINCTLQDGAVLPSFPCLGILTIEKTTSNTNETLAMPSKILPQLGWINLNGVDLDKTDCESVCSSPNIRKVVIGHSYVSSAFFHKISSVEKWYSLDLLYLTLENGCLEYLSTRANSLTLIALNGTNIDGEDLLVLPQGIEIIDVRDTAVTSKDIVAMVVSGRYPHLEKIGTELTFTEEEAAIFKKYNIEIVTEYYFI